MKRTQETVKLAPLDRRAAVTSLDPEKRTVELVFSTGADVARYDWETGSRFLERLSLDPKHIRLDRLNHGAPLLNAHSAYALADQIGIVEEGTAVLGKGEARATVRFSKRSDVEPIFRDVQDGIIRNVSVGYRVHRFEQQNKEQNELPVRLATDWEPYEISMVPMGADAGARVRASKDVDTNPCVIVHRAEEAVMAEETKTTETKDAPKTAETPPPIAEEIRAAAATAERERITEIHRIVEVSGLQRKLAEDLVASGVGLDEARKRVIDAIAVEKAKQPETDNKIRVETGEDARDKFVRGVTAWLIVKAGAAALVAQHEQRAVGDINPGEFRGLTLLDIARECLVRAGVAVRGLDKMAIVSKAFRLRDITQSTSDFTYALENTMHKVLQAAYGVTPDTWSKWCKRGTVSDFRAHYRYRMGSFGALDALAENGEFKSKAITDAERASITASTKGNIINVSRQMIVNDDMGVFAGLLTGLGRAAAMSVEVDAYALLAENSGLGPTFGAVPLFDATHANIGTGAALSAAAIDADAALMARQMDKNSAEYLDLQPAVLLVERALKGTALTINEAQYDPDTANKLQKPNTVRGLFRDVVATPRFTSASTRRYLFADPALYAVFEVAFLEGQESPVLESKDGWNSDGAEMKVRFDYGVAAVDYRGAVTNAGA